MILHITVSIGSQPVKAVVYCSVGLKITVS